MSRTPVADPDCVFCKIISGVIPSAKVLESEAAVAFLDINPVNKGHVLLVPRAHHSDLCELSDFDASATASLLPRLCRAVKMVTCADGLNVVVNNGVVAGQTVAHGHWHVIPRFKNDEVHWPWSHQLYAENELERTRTAIAERLDSLTE